MHKQRVWILAFFLILITASVLAKKKKEKQEPTEKVVDSRIPVDLCHDLKCGPGRHCVIHNDTRDAKCECVKECAENKDPRGKVCSNTNQTWETDCHLHRHRCLCNDGLLKECTEADKHLHIDYYGECQNEFVCEKNILEDFPRRMRDWLYRIMHSGKPVADSKPISSGEKLADNWVQAVVWKYCNLDVHPKDRFVSRHELFPLRAPLLSMEPCISNFLDSCDPDNDHKITLDEWGKCLGAPKGELEYKCNEYRASLEAGQEDDSSE